MTSPGSANGATPSATVALLFDQLCVRWAREADVVVQQEGSLQPTLIVLPRDKAADEIAIRLDGLRGNLAERGPALVVEIRPQTDPHTPAGVVLMSPMRLGSTAADPDGVAVYVSLGHPSLRRALGYEFERRSDGVVSLRRATTDPAVEAFTWLDALLRP